MQHILLILGMIIIFSACQQGGALKAPCDGYAALKQ